ncbi:MAG: hypothetical protein EOO90_16955 [Pedobacter sp.]|nr:MAG: hypothetical protein EOO90_16955 [Pedobacter sp.]
MLNNKLSREDRLRLSVEEVAFFELKDLARRKKISLIRELNSLLQTTKSHEIRDGVAKILYCIGDQSSLKSFINAIKSPFSKNHRGYLVLCCEAFDCSAFLLFFIELVLSENYYTTSNVMLVIKEMKGRFKKNQYEKAIDKLSLFLNNNKNDEREDIIRDLLDFLVEKQQTFLKNG